MDKNFKKIAAIEIIVLMLIWEGLALVQWIPTYLSSPSTILTAMWQLVSSGEIFAHMEASLYRSLLGFIVVVVIGVGFGILAGYYKRIGNFFDPIINAINPIPKVALLPILMVWFGMTDTTRILIIFLTAFFPSFVATRDGVRSIKQVHLWAGENMGASQIQLLYKVVFPGTLPKIFDGLRISLGLTFVMMFSSEIIGASNGSGLGFLILNADLVGRTDIMFAAVAFIGTLGFIFDRILLKIRSKVLWWDIKRA
ncbi:ABC transporter permease [Alkalihalobacillus sp. BA299]|uniref:ABC transporter permease n=1 Tax=Alkalihalobacillus sp. BA299 TaxID=2815938 RepID=UPI001ADB4578|nr:ABC transporter permease [Alkalihalobacillus sp. BA299]